MLPTGGYGNKSAKFLYTTVSRTIFGSTNDLDVVGGLQTMYKRTTRVVALEMFVLTCRVGAHIRCYAHDTRLYPMHITVIALTKLII